MRVAEKLTREFQRLLGRRRPAKPPDRMLEMIWPESKLASPPLCSVPPGFLLRTYRVGDEMAFLDLMARANYSGWNERHFHGWLARVLPEGLFFLVETADGKMVGTAMACHNPSRRHPFGGTVSCVAMDLVRQGQGLGFVVTAAATGRLIAGGYRNIYMESDDWRLAALKTYFRMGWLPLLYSVKMPDRWRVVCDQIGIPFTPEHWPQE